MINTLGLLEVSGLVAGVDAVDAMLKTAPVKLLNHQIMTPGMVTLVVEGDLAACRAAVEAGVVAANRRGTVISHHVIGRPDPDTETLVTHLLGSMCALSSNDPASSKLQPQQLLAIVSQAVRGMTAGEVAAQVDCSLEQARLALEKLYLSGRLRKRSSRYRLK
ncbi:BMC domain-containing protein [Serratia sp. DD3]|uniref:BMC domain-containing protein n=1 Tax=Serratia sp. DD3 TaxID=1410619 RepID=UPI0003C51B08|nr:BMC domain-containing protein [Serratia sp. DD3]KEY58802.1 ethanolamine utilization protein EutK [Serratia sp. DD3]